MTREMLPALLNMGAAIGALVFVAVAWRVGAKRTLLWVRFQLVALLIIPFALQVLAQGASRSTLGSAATLLAVGGGLVLVAMIFSAAGTLVAAKSQE